MVNESCLGFDPKFLELKEEVEERGRERKRREIWREERYMYMREYPTFIVLMHVYFYSSLLISFPSPPLPPIGSYSSN